MKNIAMPSRPISPKSFDDILSDLGDDPAIPDPHGIRKSGAAKSSIPYAPSPTKSPSFLDPLKQAELLNQGKKLGSLVAAALCFLGLVFGLFLAYDSSKSTSNTQVDDSSIQISKLQKDLDLLRHELDEDFNSLYEEIDLMEVSIHSLTEIKPKIKTFSKPKPHPHEQELRRWRYLGSSQMGEIQQAFFHHGKSHFLFSKGSLVLGEWRLTSIEKELVTLTHPQGKSIVLHTMKSE
jgi:hypothetical protein